MKLLGNTVLVHDKDTVNYEILLIGQMLVFKPFFYHIQDDFPCIVLHQYGPGWQFQDKIEAQLEKQIWQDIANLKCDAAIISCPVAESPVIENNSLKRA